MIFAAGAQRDLPAPSPVTPAVFTADPGAVRWRLTGDEQPCLVGSLSDRNAATRPNRTAAFQNPLAPVGARACRTEPTRLLWGVACSEEETVGRLRLRARLRRRSLLG